MNKFCQSSDCDLKLLSIVLLLVISFKSNGQLMNGRNWIYSKVNYRISPNNSTFITNSLPRGGGLVYRDGKEYNYFVFWTSILNNSPSPLEIQIKFPSLNFFNSNKSHFIATLTRAKMTSEKVQMFDYGLTDMSSLLNVESNQLKYLNNRIASQKEYLFYVPVFISKTKWPVRAEFLLKGKQLFYKIAAGTDTVIVPCGGITFLHE
jgi:hypothetical protein